MITIYSVTILAETSCFWDLAHLPRTNILIDPVDTALISHVIEIDSYCRKEEEFMYHCGIPDLLLLTAVDGRYVQLVQWRPVHLIC